MCARWYLNRNYTATPHDLRAAPCGGCADLGRERIGPMQCNACRYESDHAAKFKEEYGSKLARPYPGGG
jgi:hypothetical protein